MVLGVEVDELFKCGKDQCNPSKVDVALRNLHARGVRHVIPIHFTDTAFGGFALTGSDFENAMFKLNSKVANKDVAKPVQEENCSANGYSKACNARGLTPLGAHLIRAMMNKGMIIDIDHMSKRTTDSVLAITSARHYPVIGGHTGFVTTSVAGHKSERDKTEAQLMTMKQDGGMVSVGVTAGSAASYTPSWRGAIANTCDETSRSIAQGYLYAVYKLGGPNVAAVGLATDQFLTDMAGPRLDGHCPSESNTTRVTYPITTRHGVRLPQSQVGVPTTLTVHATADGPTGRTTVPATVRVGSQTFATDKAVPVTLCSKKTLTSVDKTGLKPERERTTTTSCAPLTVSAPGYVDVVITNYLKAQPLPR